MNTLQGGWIVSGIVVVYLVMTTFIGAWSVKYSTDTSRFMSAKGQLGTFIIGILLTSEFIAMGSTLGTSQAAFDTGLSSAWVYISLAIGFALFAIFAAGQFIETQEYTLSGVAGKKYGQRARFLVAAIACYAMIATIVVLYTGGAVVLGTILNIKWTTAVWIIAATASICVAAGGMRGVGIVNVIHFCFKYVALILIAVVAWYMLKNHPGSWERLPPGHFSLTGVGIPQIMAWSIGNIGAIFATQYVVQTISSLKTPQEARKASIIAALWLLPLGFIAAYIGLAARALFPSIRSVQALPIFIKYMNPWLAGLTAAGILAVAFVSIMACNLAATALVVKDFYMPLFKQNEDSHIYAVRLIAVIIGLLPVPFALYLPGLLKTIFFARALRAALAVIVVFWFYAPSFGTAKGVTVGLTLSIAFTTLWFLLKDPFGIDNMYIAVATPLLCMLASHLFRKRTSGGSGEQVRLAATKAT
jgi:SSS family solute:Na+ symporter